MTVNRSHISDGVNHRQTTLRIVKALLWPLWLRHRGELVGLVLLISALKVSIYLPHPYDSIPTAILGLGIGVTSIFFIGRLANGDSPSSLGDDRGFGSAYPIFMLTLPVGDKLLVYVPMLFGVICTTALFAFAGILFRPELPLSGLEISSIVTCSVTISLQGLAWSRFQPTYVKPWLVAILLIGFIPLWSITINERNPAICYFTYLGFFGLSMLLTPLGFSRARHSTGNQAISNVRTKQADIANFVDRPPFVSMIRTQDWILWKRHGVFLPMICLVWCMVFLIAGAVPLIFDSMFVDQTRSVARGRIMNVLTFFDYILLVSFLVGVIPRKGDLFRSDFNLHPFASTRPISGAEFVGSVIRVSLRGSLLTAGITAGITAGTMLCSTFALGINPGPSAQDFLDKISSSPVPLPLACLFCFSLMAMFIWSSQTLLFAWEISGRRPVVYVGLLLICSVIVVAWIVTSANESWIRSQAVVIAWGFVSVKIIGTAVAIYTLKRNELVSLTHSMVGVGIWAAIVLLIWKVFPLIFPNQIGDSIYHAFDPALWLPIVILITPLARFFVAPLSFEWNRHR